MSVLITGIGGHIGSNAARMLIEEGQAVVGLDVAPPGPHTVLADQAERYRFVAGSVTDLARLLNTVAQHKVESIIHGAVMQSELANARPLESVRVNVEGTLNVLETVRIAGLRRVVCCSSSSVVGEHKGRPLTRLITEQEIDWPLGSVYALTKHTNEGQVYLYRTLYGVDAVACRPSRVWGPGYHRWDLPPPIEILIREAVAGRPITLERGADTLIDYTYVKDVARGLIQAMRATPTKSFAFNMSGGRLISLSDVAAVLRKITGTPIEIGPGELDPGALSSRGPSSYRVALRPGLDISAARRELGYNPDYGIEKGIPAYVAWLRERKYD